MAITVAELQAIISADTRGFEGGLTSAQQKLKAFGSSMQGVGSMMTIGLTAPLVLMGKAALDAGRSFESAFAGVRKTVEATEPEFAVLRQAFRDLAKEIPITVNELANIGEAAGALGVRKEDILGFTRVMADLGVTTDLTSDQAATALARIANIMQNEAGPQFDRLGATIVALGNAGASTETEIVAMSLRIAGAGKQAGLSEADVLSFASALSSVGIEAEAGGSAISRAFIKMADATKMGGAELKVFAAVSGQTAAAFKKSFEQDAASAMISFISGLNKMTDAGQSLTPVLEELGLSEIRVRDALLRASSASELFTEQLAIGRTAWAENIALVKEAQERYKTFDSQLQLLGNAFTDLGITLFDTIVPGLDSLVRQTTVAIGMIGKFEKSALLAGVTVAAVFAAAGPIVLGIGTVIAILGGPLTLAVIAITSLIAAFAAAVVTDFGGITTAIKAWAGNSKINFVAVAGFVGACLDAFLIFGRIVVSVMDAVITSIVVLVKVVSQAFPLIKGFIEATVGLATNDLGKMAAGVVQMAAAMATGLQGALAQARGFIQRDLQRISDSAENFSGKYAKSFAFAVAGMGGFVSAVQEGAVKLKTAAETLQNALNNITNPPAGKEGGAKAIQDELNKTIDAINEWLKATDVQLQISETVWAKLPAITRKAFIEQSLEFHKNEIAIGAWQANVTAALLSAGKAFEINFSGEGSRKEIALTLAAYLSLSVGVRKSVTEMGGTFKIVFPGMVKDMGDFVEAGRKMAIEADKAFDGLGDTVSQFSDEAKRAFEVISDAAPHWAGSVVDAAKRIDDAIKNSATVMRAEAEIKIGQSGQSVVDLFARMGEQAGLTGKALIDFIQNNLAKLGPELGLTGEALAKFGVAVNKAFSDLIRLPGIWNDVFRNSSAQVKGWVGDILNVVGTMPGKFGQSLNKIRAEIESWLTFMNSILAILNRIFGKDIPGSITGLVDKIISVFKGSQPALATTAGTFGGVITDSIGGAVKAGGDVLAGTIKDTVAGAIEKAGTGTAVKGATSKIGGALGGQFVAAFGVALAGAQGVLAAASAPNRVAGAISGGLSGAIAGAMIGSIFGPAGTVIGLAIGAIVGVIGGLFKSELQKAQEKLALQQAKDGIALSMQSVVKGAQEVIQSTIKSMRDALAFFNELDQFTAIRKQQFQRFFTAFTRLMDFFVEMSKKWAGDSLQKAKVLAEVLGPVVQVIAAAPQALDAIGQYLGVGAASVERFFVDFGLVFDRFSQLAEEMVNKAEKQAKKTANRLIPVVELMAQTVAALTGMADLKPIPEGSFDILKSSLLTFVGKLGELAEFFDKTLLKAIAFFAEKAGPAVELWAQSVEAIKGMAEVPAPSPGAFATLFAGIEAAINGMIDLASRLSTEGLSRAQSIATASLSIFSAIKAAVEALTSLQTYKDVASEVFAAFAADFDAAITMMESMNVRAIQFENVAKLFEGYIRSGAVHLETAFEMLRQIMLGAGAFFPGGSPVTVPGGESGSFSASSSSTFASTRAGAGTGSSVTNGPTTIVNIGDISVSLDTPEQRAALQAFLNLFGRTGIDAVANQYS